VPQPKKRKLPVEIVDEKKLSLGQPEWFLTEYIIMKRTACFFYLLLSVNIGMQF